MNKARKRLDDAIQAGGDNKKATEDFDAANARLDGYLEAVQQGKGRWSDVGRALQAGTEMDTGNFADVLGNFQRKAGRQATDRESGAIAKEVEAIQAEVKKAVPDYDPETETVYQALERAQKNAMLDAKAKAGAERMFRDVARRRGTRTVQTIRAEREAVKSRISELFKQTLHGGGAQSGGLQTLFETVPEMAKEIQKYIKLVIEEHGLNKLDPKFYETVYERLREIPEFDGVDITDSDIRATFAGFFEKTVRTQSDAEKALALLQKKAGTVENIERIMEGGTTFRGTKRAGAPTDAELLSLRKQLRILQRQIGDAPESASARTKIENILRDLEAQKSGKFRPIKEGKTVPAFEDIRAQIKELRQDLRYEDKIYDLEDQLRTNQFKGPSKRVDQLTRQQEFQKAHILNLEKSIRSRINAANRGFFDKALRNIAEPIRGTILGSDIGVLTRQGLFTMSRPASFVKGVGKGLYAMLSDTHLSNVERGMAERTVNVKGRGIVPVAPIQRKAGLQISSVLHGQEEEIVATRLLQRIGLKAEDLLGKIPVVGKPLGAAVGRPFGALGRFQAAMINTARADIFDYAVRHGYSEKELAQRAAFINNATGRGNFKNVPGLAQIVMTSPRYEASRWSMIGEALRNPARLGKDLVTGKGYNKAAAANIQDMAVTAAGVYGVMKLAELSGYKVDFDPKSSDFLKMRRYEGDEPTDDVWDITAGIAPRLRDALRVVLFMDNPEYGKTVTDVVGKAGVRVLNPAVRTSTEQYSYARQRKAGITEEDLKNPFSGFLPEEEAKGWAAWAPLIYKSFHQELREGSAGVEGGVKAATKEFVGGSSNRYPPPKKD